MFNPPIATDIPPPEKKSLSAQVRAVLMKLKVNDSIYVEQQHVVAIRAICAEYKARNPGWDYATCREGEGLRVWRTA